MSNDASPRGKFWDILTSISKDIPRISTDFITPDGIDYKKLFTQITHINAKKLLPLATTGKTSRRTPSGCRRSPLPVTPSPSTRCSMTST